MPIHDDHSSEVKYTKSRWEMVRDHLQQRGVKDRRVLSAMAMVPREKFVAKSLRPDAYADSPLPIGYGQTISQPLTVALMAEAAQLSSSDKILEVGTGSGYAAAVLSQLVHEVHTVERIPELAEKAKGRMALLEYQNVHVHIADGSLGYPPAAPFDAILVTAAAPHLPPVYFEQLADRGRAIIPLGDLAGRQRLFRFTRHNDRLFREDLGPFSFVPLVGEYGWNEKEADEADHNVYLPRYF